MPKSDESSPFLRLSDDVLLDICDAVSVFDVNPAGNGISKHDPKPLSALSQCNRRLRTIMAAHIYRSIYIHPSKDWNKVYDVLQSISACEKVRRYTERFVINLTDIDRNETTSESGIIPMFMDGLVRLLGSMTKLNHMTIWLCSHAQAIHAFENALELADASLTTVRSLIIDTETHFVIPRCPNLQYISSEWISQWFTGGSAYENDRALIVYCGSASQLQHFEMRGRWTTFMLDIIWGSMPGLPSLAMTGQRYREGLAEFMPTLAQFKQLRCLLVTSASVLDLASQPHDGDGDAHEIPDAHELRRRAREDPRQTDRNAARMCFAACAALEVLWIGDCRRATVVRDANGGVCAIDVVEGLQRVRPLNKLDCL